MTPPSEPSPTGKGSKRNGNGAEWLKKRAAAAELRILLRQAIWLDFTDTRHYDYAVSNGVPDGNTGNPVSIEIKRDGGDET